jgi:hypothetical protein
MVIFRNFRDIDFRDRNLGIEILILILEVLILSINS